MNLRWRCSIRSHRLADATNSRTKFSQSCTALGDCRDHPGEVSFAKIPNGPRPTPIPPMSPGRCGSGNGEYPQQGHARQHQGHGQQRGLPFVMPRQRPPGGPAGTAAPPRPPRRRGISSGKSPKPPASEPKMAPPVLQAVAQPTCRPTCSSPRPSRAMSIGNVSRGETGGHFRGERGPVRKRMNRGEMGTRGQATAETGEECEWGD